MRVFRIECERNMVDHIAVLRENRYGGFNWGMVSSFLFNEIPGPRDDFGIQLEDNPNRNNLFFTFPTFDWIADYAEHYKTEEIIIAEYEVEPYLKSEWQVIFDKRHARFISEVPLKQLVS